MATDSDTGEAVKYLVVYERASGNWSAYVPDLPGCVATGKTLDETAETMREAIAFPRTLGSMRP